MKKSRYKIFDQAFELCSDHVDTLNLIDAMFGRFAMIDNKKEGEILRYEVLTKLGGQAGIATKDYCYRVESPARLPSLAYGIISRNTLTRVRSHLLFHAAALSWCGKGVILAADSGCGKTTLTLALVRHGFKFLSDEVAALALKNGELVPYPRSLSVRVGTFHVFQQWGWEWPSHEVVFKSEDRKVIHLSSGFWGENCQPHCLVILQRPEQADERICEVTLDSLPERLWIELAALGIQSYSKNQKGFSVLKAKEVLMNQIHEACERQGILVLDVAEQAVAPSYYEKTPQLHEISKLTAAITLLQYFLGNCRSVLIQKRFQGSAVGLIEPLVNILKPVKCYQLTPGRLDQTVEIIHALC